MSLSTEELKTHCKYILGLRKILNRVVVLCEGDIFLPEEHERILSPHTYQGMEKMPDSNFYKACKPQKWRAYLPHFFNCGDRKDVIDTYFELLETHEQNPENSYLDPNRLFALVDLDIQTGEIEYDYPYSNTKDIFENLYDNGQVKESNINLHRIWVTGLIHKEAYFLLPELQKIFDSHNVLPVFNGLPLNLDSLYATIANDLIEDADLKKHFDNVCYRIDYCRDLNCNSIEELKNSWQHQFMLATTKEEKRELSIALLMIAKAKNYWHEVTPDPAVKFWLRNDAKFREELLWSIAKFYSRQDSIPQNHIPMLFERLFQLA